MFRAIPLSDRLYVIVFFDTSTESLSYEVLEGLTRAPVLAHKDMDNKELLALANIVNSITEWANDMSADFPISNDGELLAKHRSGAKIE